MSEFTYETSGKRGTDAQNDTDNFHHSKRQCNIHMKSRESRLESPRSMGVLGPSTRDEIVPIAPPNPHSHHSHPQKQQLPQQQWLLRRRTESGHENTLVVMEHLGDACTLVESLTHQLDSWSLISHKHSIPKQHRNKERVQVSKRELMKALLPVVVQPQSPPPQRKTEESENGKATRYQDDEMVIQ